MRISELFLAKTKYRDHFIFLSFCLTSVFLFQVAVVELIWPDFSSFTFLVLLVVQFYWSAFFMLPIRQQWLKLGIYFLIFPLNFFLFKELAHSLLPIQVRAAKYFELSLILVFLMTVIGRNIRMYLSLLTNLQRLNALREHRMLFSSKEEVMLNFGNEGKIKVHPNEMVYIRTKDAGDHTKIFGLKRKKKAEELSKLVEYETLAYQNFNDVFKVLAPYPQLKRISQSTVINFQYPHEEKSGVIHVESRRFAISPNYKPRL